MANSNVIYCEPNFTFTAPDPRGEDMFNIVPIAPPMEDYCVVVDLEVEVPIRPLYGVIKSSDKVIHIQYSSSLNGKGKLSFNQGRKYVGSDNYYLTTEPYDMGTFFDIKREGENTSEMFGINSITIEYQTYMVPVVTVQFTDIRGLSLFGAEDLRHNVTSEGGIEYSANDAIAGSFFKCFFTFPYPKFRIMVKGFYGNPVSYELVCSDFRANFDSSTGNFGATAKFVGYTFSVLNDLTITSLLASPRSEYFGKKYWENNQNKFVFSDGRPMRPILDVIDDINEFKKNLDKSDSNDEINDLQASLNKITAIKAAHDNYFTCLSSMIAEQASNDGIYIVGTKYRAATQFVLGGDTRTLDTYYNTLKNAVESANLGVNDIKTPIPFGKKSKPITELKDNDYYGCNDEVIKRGFDEKDEFYNYDGSVLYEKIINAETNLVNRIEVRQNAINSERNDKIEAAIGFKPSVRNITELILAHVETFIQEIYECASNVNKLPKDADFSYRKDTDVTDGFYAFPTVTETVTNNRVKKNERSWVGKYDLSAPEAQLVDKLLKATTSAEGTISTYRDTVVSRKPDVGIGVKVEVPILPCDLFGNSNPFEDINYESNYDLCGKLLVRALVIRNSLIALKNEENANPIMREIGRADAVNFYKENNSITNEFRTQLSAGGTFTTNEIFKLLTDDGSVLAGRGDAIWNTPTHPYNRILTKYNEKEYYCDFFKKDNDNKRYIAYPLSSFEWENVSSVINKNISTLLGNESFYSLGFPTKSPNVFKIEKNWGKYSSYANFRPTNDSETISSLYDLNTNNSMLSSFYRDILSYKSILSQKWSDSYTDDNEIYPTLIPPTFSGRLSEKDKMLYDSNSDIVTVNSTSSDNDNKSLVTLSESDLKTIFDNGFKFNEYTLNYFCGYKKGSLSNEISIFGQIEYYYVYERKGVQAAALMFLNTFKWDYNLIKSILENNNIVYVPYLFAVTIGGYLKMLSDKSAFNYEKIEEIGDNDFMGYRSNMLSQFITLDIRTYSFFNSWVNTLDESAKDEFKSLFDEWVRTDFAQIHNELALHVKDKNRWRDVPTLIRVMASKYQNRDNNFKYPYQIIEYLREALHDNFFKNYKMIEMSVLTNQVGFKLIHREESDVVKDFTNKLLSPCIIFNSLREAVPFVNGGYQSKLRKDGPYIEKSLLTSYLDGFVAGLKENMPKDNTTTATTSVETFETLASVKVQLYNYLKNIWDRWISGNPKDKGKYIWDFDVLRERWHYLDAFYNNLNDAATINIFDLVDDITNSYDVIGSSALSIMSSTYARSRFNLMCVQNFANLTDESLMMDMFKPIPYEKIDLTKVKNTPDFIVMYINEPSSKLDMQGSAYSNDSFMVGVDDMQLPIAIKTKKLSDGYRIPAFGVTYGSQYQSYFTDIQVGMENPQVTDQALQAQFEIIRKADTNDVRQVGQDLFTIYSNQSFTCTVKMMGCAWVQPLMYFQLNNIPMFKGSYLIQKVTHNISQGKMETTFVGTRISRFSTPFVENGLLYNPNNQNGGYKVEQNVENTNASLDNNCKYKFFNPNVSGESGVEAYPSKRALGLFNALKKTVEFSEKTKIKELKYDNLEERQVFDDDTIRIRCNDGNGMSEIFDILLNTYYDYFSELHWVVDNSGIETPKFVQVKASDSFDKVIGISKISNKSSNKLTILNQYEGLNEKFYMSLAKKYGKDVDNPTIFKTNCKNFSEITSKSDDEWIETVKKILNVGIYDCYDVSKSISSIGGDYETEIVTDTSSSARFTWKGVNNYGDKVAITSPSGTYNKMKVAEYAFKSAPGTTGKCAKYVRLAMEQEKEFKLITHPVSACRYAEHLPYWGFKVVYSGVSGAKINGYTPEVGDIAVIAGLVNGDESKLYGHIQIYYKGELSNGEGYWCSDFKTKNVWCYGSPNGRPFKIFRHV